MERQQKGQKLKTERTEIKNNMAYLSSDIVTITLNVNGLNIPIKR